MINRLEKLFMEEGFDGKEDFKVLKGKIPLMVSAPHSVVQQRDGLVKSGEYRTGVLAKLLNDKTSCHAIFKTKNLKDDANYDEHSEYRNKLVEYVKENQIEILLDLHICSADRAFDFEIGTGKGKNIFERDDLLQLIVEKLEKHYKYVEIDKVFKASYPHTVSATVAREAKIPCFQIEINWRNISENEEFNKVLDIFGIIVEELYNKMYRRKE